MNKSSWKDIAELVGIAAIVASLLFVGLEMRQSHQIALAEQQGEQIPQTQNTAAILIEHADLVSKLNSGQSLDNKEKYIVDNVILAVRAHYFFSYRRWDYLDHPAVQAPVRAFAILLNQNPGLERLWAERRRERETDNLAMGASPDGQGSRFDGMVASYLRILDDL